MPGLTATSFPPARRRAPSEPTNESLRAAKEHDR
jgi:hypothetical protein